MPETTPHPLYLLTKSKFIAGRQCLKKMYLDVHHRDLATPDSAAQQFIYDCGNEVGKEAHKLFPGGEVVPLHRPEPQKAQRLTQVLLEDSSVPAIFEGAFLFNDTWVRVDVLRRQDDGSWHLIECKATTKTKEEHLWDVALQSYVLKGCGIQVRRCSVLHINREYRRGSSLHADSFMTSTDVSAAVEKLGQEVPQQVSAMKAVLMAPQPPNIEPDAHCEQPYSCKFWAWCTKDKAARWIGYLPDGARQVPKLAARGARTLDDIPPGFPLSTIQHSAVRREEWRGPGLRQVVKRLRYPIHHLHIEAAWYGIPLLPGVKPYERVPFQWTNLREYPSGMKRQGKWVDLNGKRAPVLSFVESLLASLGPKGSIVVYSDVIPQMLEKLAQRLSGGTAHKTLLKELLPRFVDLRQIIRKSYYHPNIKYSAYDSLRRDTSIGDLLGMLPEDGGYHLVSTLDSGWASRHYWKIIESRTPQSQVEQFRDQVLLRSSQVVRALYETGRLLRTPAPQPRKRNARRARAA